jgi:hypothetical protein
MELGDIHRSYEALCAAWLKFDALCACLIARAYETYRAEAGCGRDTIRPRSHSERGTIAGRLRRCRTCTRNDLQRDGVRPLRWLEMDVRWRWY